MGTLYVCATPIGNLKDITLRALEHLRNADLILAEDTRQTGKLLAHFQIEQQVVSYNEHNHRQKIDWICCELQQSRKAERLQ